MEVFQYKGKTYEVDTQGFLIDYNQWDEDFAQGMAPNVNIPGALTEKHWDLIRFIRDSFKQTGECPLVYKTCKANRLSAKGLKELFPTGYMRGACKLAGITHRDRIVNYYGEESPKIRLIAEEERERIKGG